MEAAEPVKTKRSYTKRAPPPRLGTPESGKWLVDEIAKAFPDAKPTDWRSVNTMMQYAMRHGRYWGQLKRGE